MIEFLFFLAAGIGIASLLGTFGVFCWAVVACTRERRENRRFERELAEAEAQLGRDLDAFTWSTFEWPAPTTGYGRDA